MNSFQGFPSGTRSIPVPSLLLGSLLEEIEDIAEIRCTLRFFWHISQVKGTSRFVGSETLLADQILLLIMGSVAEIERGLSLAVEHGTLVFQDDGSGSGRYFINDIEGRNAALKANDRFLKLSEHIINHNDSPALAKSNIYRLYESNIGILTPIISEELRDAETIYPLDWIELAIKESVENNARSWRYVSRVLERWKREGNNVGADGKPRRNPETITAAEYRRESS